MSLRIKFLVILLISLLIPISVIGVFVNIKMAEVLKNDVNQINQTLLEKLCIQLEDRLSAIKNAFNLTIEDSAIGFYLFGSTNTFEEKIKKLQEDYTELRRIYITPTGTAVELVPPYVSPELPAGVEKTDPVWQAKWLERPEEELRVWDGPYVSPDGQISLIYPGPAYSLSKTKYGLVVFEVNVEILKSRLVGNLETKDRHISFITKEGKDYLTGKDYSKETFFRTALEGDFKSRTARIDREAYLTYIKYLPILDGYILILENQNSAFASRREVSWFILIISLVAFIGALVVMAVYMQKTVILPVEELKSAAGQVAAGDLTIHTGLKRDDELGVLANSFNTMTEKLREVITRLRGASEKMHQSCNELQEDFTQMDKVSTKNNDMIMELAHIAENQSADLNEASTLTTSIFSSLKELEKQVKEVTDNSSRVLSSAKNGQHELHQAVGKITVINDNVQQIIEEMDDLKARSREINEITDLIKQITEQTNLLALNASIEAARAGEAGAGFAVVASQIRNLAEQSKTATARITELVHQVQSRIEQVSKSVQEEVTDFTQGVKLVDGAGAIFGLIVEDILHVNKMIQETKGHIEKITTDGEAIEKNITDVAAQAEESAASAEEIAASSEDNLKIIDHLRELVSHLQELSEDLGQHQSKFKTEA